MMRVRFLFVCLCLFAFACGDDETKHVLVIGLDGVRSDALLEAATPFLDALVANGTVSYDAFAGGKPGTASEQRTLSGPGWSSILTGVWTNKHRVTDNEFEGSRFDEYPHFFHRIREKKPDAYLSSFVTWGPINDVILAPDDASEQYWPDVPNSAEADVMVTDAVVAHLANRDPEVVFVHLDNPDFQGHPHTFSPTAPEYVNAIEAVDGQIGRMLNAIRARPTYESEDWLVVVTTDHGGLGQLHGGQSAEERTIPLVVSGGETAAQTMVSPGPGHTVVPPTVLRHLGIPVDSSWGWESQPFGL